ENLRGCGSEVGGWSGAKNRSLTQSSRSKLRPPIITNSFCHPEALLFRIWASKETEVRDRKIKRNWLAVEWFSVRRESREALASRFRPRALSE
ncbi:MAG: hypothetical protein PHX36_11230, partial [Mesotoga sp.]|nr:hypothetical protein [Mesotoga sp.]